MYPIGMVPKDNAHNAHNTRVLEQTNSLPVASAKGKLLEGAAASYFAALLAQLTEQQGQQGQLQQSPLHMLSGSLSGPGPLAMQPSLSLLTVLQSFAGASDDRHSADLPYGAYIDQASAMYGVDASLIRAVIQTESNYKADAISHAGAKGLMQLMDGTARAMGVTDSFDPEQNINGGTRYLAFLLHKFKGQELAALAAYNAGPGRVDRLGIRTDADVMRLLHTLPAETQRYVEKVMQARN